MNKLIATCSLVVLTGLANAGAVEEIQIDDLEKHIEAGTVTLLDVTGTSKYKKGHIPGAINYQAHADELPKHLPEKKDALIVAYCGGVDSTRYKHSVKAAEQLGYTNVKYLPIGIYGWKKAGKTVETD